MNYRPLSGSKVIFLEHFPDEAVLRLFPARVDAFGQRLSGTVPLAFRPPRRPPLPLRFPRPLGPVRGSEWEREAGVWWYALDLEGFQSARRSK
jgi:hypothetical protein